MNTQGRAVLAAAAMAMLLALTAGCQNPTYEQLQDDKKQLLGENDELSRQLAAAKATVAEAQRDRDLYGGQVATLQDKINQLVAEKDKQGGGVPGKGGFTEFGTMAMISVPGDLLFASGKVAVKSGADAKLQSIAQTLNNSYAGREVYVIGHTDNDPIKKSGWKDNWELSCQRSLSVARKLIAAGVASSRVIAAGRADTQPRTANATDAGKAQNRRVEIYAVMPSQGG